MDLINLGRAGLKVSRLCLGTMNFGPLVSEAESFALMDKALEIGINFIDSADVYGGRAGKGATEDIVGRWLAQGDRREKIVLATKVYGRMGDGPNDARLSAYHIRGGCDASLKRLQTDRIDLYQIHRPQWDIPIDETLRAMDDLIKAGKVLYIGTSTFAAWQVVESVYVARELGLNRFVSEQPPYNLLDRRIERELLPAAQNYGYAIIPWSPLAGGLLSGKYQLAGARPKESRFAERSDWSDRLFSEPAFRVADALSSMAREKGCSPAQLALAWCVQAPGVTSPIIGPRTLEQLTVTLTDEDRKKIDTFAPPGRATATFYEADFRASVYRQI